MASIASAPLTGGADAAREFRAQLRQPGADAGAPWMLGSGTYGYPAKSPEMERPSFLYAIAGVSMSMAGFTGVVAALRRTEAVRAQHLFWIGIILWHCLAATFLALFPVTLYALWPDAAGVLRVSSAVLAVFALERFWRSLQSRRLWRPSVGLIAVGASIRTVDSLLALVNVAIGSLGLYELALLLLLGMPAYSFGMLFTFGLDAPTEPEARPPTGR